MKFFLALMGIALVAGSVSAQDPYQDLSPAYRHFLTSPYSFRTYSSMGSARSWGYDTPFESGRFEQTPGYYHEEIAPWGRWASGVTPEVHGYVIHRPVYPPVFVPVYPPPP